MSDTNRTPSGASHNSHVTNFPSDPLTCPNCNGSGVVTECVREGTSHGGIDCDYVCPSCVGGVPKATIEAVIEAIGAAKGQTHELAVKDYVMPAAIEAIAVRVVRAIKENNA